MFDTWGPLLILWASKGVDNSSSPTLPPTGHRLRPAPLHSCTSSLSWALFRDSGCHIIPRPNFSPWLQSWGFCCNWSCTFTNTSSWSRLVQRFRYSRWPLHTYKPVPPGWLLNIAKFSCQNKVQCWPPLDHSFCVMTLRKHFLEYFASIMLVSY